MLRSDWQPGSAAGGTGGPVIVSVTEFTSDRFRDLPGIARAGLELRRAWPHLDGAVGMWLWAVPLTRRTGSVSVWTSETARQGFVRWPPHVTIMRRYRGRGQVRAKTWEARRFDESELWRDACRQLIAVDGSSRSTDTGA